MTEHRLFRVLYHPPWPAGSVITGVSGVENGRLCVTDAYRGTTVAEIRDGQLARPVSFNSACVGHVEANETGLTVELIGE